MLKSLSTFNFKKLPWAALLTVLTLFLLEWGVRQSHFLKAPADQIVEHKAKYLAGRGLSYDAILMGDSRLLELDAHLIAEEIKKVSGKNISTYNFSFPNMGIRSYSVFLNKYLKRHKKPEFILFESMPLVMTGDWDIVGRPLNSAELHRLLKVFSFTDYFAYFPQDLWIKMLIKNLTEFSHLYTYGERVRDFLKKKLKNEEFDARKIEINKDGRLMWKEATHVVSEEVLANSYVMKKEFRLNPHTLEWYERFFDRALEEGIRIYMFNTPLPSKVIDKREHEGAQATYEKALQELVKPYPNVQLVGPLARKYDRKLFRDPTHLNELGAEQFSSELGREVGYKLLQS